MNPRILTIGALALLGCGRSSYEAPVTVATGEVSNPTVARANDAVLVAWVGQDGNVYLKHAQDGAEPVRVNDVPGEAAPHEQAPAQVAAGLGGAVWVIWQTRVPVEGRRFPASDLRLARSTDGGRTFAPAITVNDDAGGPKTSHTFHDLLVGHDGTVFTSWIDGRSTEGHHGSDHASHLGPEVRVARSTDGGRTFSASVVVDRDACPCCRTALARGTDGTVYVAWRKVFAGDVRDVVVARSRDGGASFERPVRVHADGWVYPGCPHAGPSIALDSAGALHAVWYTGAEGRAGLYLATSTDGGVTFGDPVRLTRNDVVPVSHARLAAAGGSVWAAWEDRSQQGGRVAVSRLDARGAPGSRADLPGSGRSPALVGGPEGPAVAWLAGDSVRVAIFH